jgi:hypothetical protein
MERNKFINYMNAHKISWREQEGKIHITNSGNVTIPLSSIPSGIRFDNTGDVELLSANSIPSDTIFNNFGWVECPNVETIEDNVSFNRATNVSLTELKKIGENVVFNNKYTVYFDNLPIFSKGDRFYSKTIFLSENKEIINSYNLDGIEHSKILNCMISQLYG